MKVLGHFWASRRYLVIRTTLPLYWVKVVLAMLLSSRRATASPPWRAVGGTLVVLVARFLAILSVRNYRGEVFLQRSWD